MWVTLFVYSFGHSLYKTEDTFKHNYVLVNPSRIRRSSSVWQEPYAAEAASQVAMWITVSPADFPTLTWEVLSENVLAHYVPSQHHISLNLVHANGFFGEPHQLRLTLIHELLHAFEFGQGNRTAVETSWRESFDSDAPSIIDYHWSTDAEGFHKRTYLPADKEVMQPYLTHFSYLSMPSLVSTSKEIRNACELKSDCGNRKECIITSDLWVGTCETISPKESGTETVLAIALTVSVIAFGVAAVVVSS